MIKFGKPLMAKYINKGVTKKSNAPYTLITVVRKSKQCGSETTKIWCFNDVPIQEGQEFILERAESVELSCNKYKDNVYYSISIVANINDIKIPGNYVPEDLTDFDMSKESCDESLPF